MFTIHPAPQSCYSSRSVLCSLWLLQLDLGSYGLHGYGNTSYSQAEDNRRPSQPVRPLYEQGKNVQDNCSTASLANPKNCSEVSSMHYSSLCWWIFLSTPSQAQLFSIFSCWVARLLSRNTRPVFWLTFLSKPKALSQSSPRCLHKTLDAYSPSSKIFPQKSHSSLCWLSVSLKPLVMHLL